MIYLLSPLTVNSAVPLFDICTDNLCLNSLLCDYNILYDPSHNILTHLLQIYYIFQHSSFFLGLYIQSILLHIPHIHQGSSVCNIEYFDTTWPGFSVYLLPYLHWHWPFWFISCDICWGVKVIYYERPLYCMECHPCLFILFLTLFPFYFLVL